MELLMQFFWLLLPHVLGFCFIPWPISLWHTDMHGLWSSDRLAFTFSMSFVLIAIFSRWRRNIYSWF
jgi:hypothetical protein